jgi:hypothetical protein
LPPEKKDNRPKWSPTPHIEAGLRLLEGLGVYGDNQSKIINHVLGQELARLLEAGVMTREELAATANAIIGTREPQKKTADDD